MNVAESERLVVSVVPLSRIDATDIDRWRQLEDEAIENDPFLSPDFLLPAARHLTPPTASPTALMAERADGAHRRLVGLGVFEHSSPSRRLPLPHAEAYCSRHSFLSGLLVGRDRPEATLEALLVALGRSGLGGHGLEFQRLPAEGPLAEAIRVAASRLGACWHELERWERATLPLGSAQAPEELLSPRRRKSIRRSRRLLEQEGAVTWRMRQGAEVDESCVETFLDLENRGWKAEGGTSLATARGGASFFREMIMGFRGRGRAFVTELALDGRVIASTANLVSGRTAFAFKIGWDPQYASMSPGVLNEYEFLKVAGVALPGIDFVDSCANPGSFVESLWRGRRVVATGVLALTRGGRLSLAVAGPLRRLKRSLSRRIWARPAGKPLARQAASNPTSGIPKEA